MTRPNVTTVARPRARRTAQHGPPADREPLPQIDGWDLIQPVYEGPFAVTYRARPAGLTGNQADRPPAYAVKLLRRQWWDEPLIVGLLCREALVGRTVSHRHLISVLTAGVDEPPYYLVTPWLEGQTLAALLDQQNGPEGLDVPIALWTARQVAEALGALDEAGWIHGDVKPGNVFISPSGHVTLLDLGFARRREETGSVCSRPSPGRPVMGTCRYIAPEAITSSLAMDIRSDIYSLGAVLFEMLALRAPFEAADLAELAREHREARPPDLRRLAPQVPSGIARLIAQMLAKQPLRRPQTPGELVERLASLEIATFAERSL